MTEFARHQSTGLPVLLKTGLVPVICQVSVPERGWNVGEARGIRPEDAAVALRSGAARLNEGAVPKEFLGVVPNAVQVERGLTAEEALRSRAPAPAPAGNTEDMK